MKANVIVFPGSNCDRDVKVALEKFQIQTTMVWHQENSMPKSDLVVLPGGFSYGDYLRCGSMASKSNIMNEVIKHADKGAYLIGICNGFQILTECGLLDGALMKNSNQLFKCEKINLKVMNNETVFTKNFKLSEVISMPIAHSQGNYFVKPDDLKKIEDNDQIIFKYSSIFGDVSEKYNPNGSISNIAGISNKKKNVMGLMPHPERAIENFYNGNDGIKFFENLKDLI